MGSESRWTIHELTTSLDDGSEGHSGPKAKTHFPIGMESGS